MTVPYTNNLSWSEQAQGRLPRQTNLLDQVLGNRFNQSGTTGAGSPASTSQSATQAGPPGSTPMTGATTMQNPFRANLSTPTTASQPNLPQPPSGGAQGGQTQTAPPTGPVTNADGSRSFGGYTIDANGNLTASPYQRSSTSGGRDTINWGSFGTQVDGQTQGFNQLTPENLAALQALGADTSMWNDQGGYDIAGAGDRGASVQTPAADGGQTSGSSNAAHYSSFGMDPALDALVQQGLIQPSRYTPDLIQSMWDSRAGDIDNQYDQANRGLMTNLAQRGIRDSTFGGQAEQNLIGQRRTAKERMAQGLAEDTAATMASDRSRAISDAMALRGQQIGQSQFDQNFDLAKMFGLDDRSFRNNQADFNNRLSTEQFNADQQNSSTALYQWLVQQGLI